MDTSDPGMTRVQPGSGGAPTLGELIGVRGAQIRWGCAAAFLIALFPGDLFYLGQQLIYGWGEIRLQWVIHLFIGNVVLAASALLAWRWIRNDALAALAAAGAHAVVTSLVELGLDALFRDSERPAEIVWERIAWTLLHKFGWTLFFLLGLALVVRRTRQTWLGLGVGAALGALAWQVVGLLLSWIRGFGVHPHAEFVRAVQSVLVACLFAGAFWVGLRWLGFGPVDKARAPFQRSLIIWAIVGLGLLGAMALVQVVDETLGQSEIKMTALYGFVAFFCLTAVAASVRLEKGFLVSIGWLGIAASAAALILTTTMLLMQFPDLTLTKLLLIAVVLALTAALSSLVLLVRGRGAFLDALAIATVSLLAINAVISIVQTLGDRMPERWGGQFAGTVSILSSLGVFVTPLLARLQRLKAGAAAGPGSQGRTPFQVPLIVVVVAGLLLLGIMLIIQTLGEIRFGETENKLMGAFTSLALFGLTALAASLRLEKASFVAVGWVGLGASAVGFPLMLATVLARRPDETVAKALVFAISLALAAALGSLVLQVRGRSGLLDGLAVATLSLLSLSAMIFIVNTVGELREPWLGTLLSSAFILGSLGLAVTPLLARLGRLKEG